MRSLIAILLGAGLILTAGCDRQSSDTPQEKVTTKWREEPKFIENKPEAQGTLDISHRGEDAPNVKFNAPDGSEVTLANFRGKPVLVNLWATWCGPCVAEMPTLDALAMRQADKLTVLTVSQDMQGKEIVDKWWSKQSYKLLEPYLDQENNLGFAFNTGMVPTTVLYDKDGKEIWRVIGGMDWDGPRANTLMAEAVGG